MTNTKSYIPLIYLMMDAANNAETLVNFYQFTQHNNLEASCENLKSHKVEHTQ